MKYKRLTSFLGTRGEFRARDSRHTRYRSCIMMGVDTGLLRDGCGGKGGKMRCSGISWMTGRLGCGGVVSCRLCMTPMMKRHVPLDVIDWPWAAVVMYGMDVDFMAGKSWWWMKRSGERSELCLRCQLSVVYDSNDEETHTIWRCRLAASSGCHVQYGCWFRGR